MPRERSTTFEYGFWNRMSRNFSSASVNQATSVVERWSSSSKDAMPFRDMNFIRFERAMVAGEGRQTISPPKPALSVVEVVKEVLVMEDIIMTNDE